MLITMFKKIIAFFIRLSLVKRCLSHLGTRKDIYISYEGFNDYVEYIMTGKDIEETPQEE